MSTFGPYCFLQNKKHDDLQLVKPVTALILRLTNIAAHVTVAQGRKIPVLKVHSGGFYWVVGFFGKTCVF